MTYVPLVVGLLGLVALAPGCSTSPRYRALRTAADTPRPGAARPAAALPRVEPPGMPASGDVWGSLDVLTASALVEQVVARNPSLAAMQAAWRAAIERYPQVTALDDPELSYAVGPGTIGTGFVYGQKIDLSQRFPWPGQLRARGEAALHEAEAGGDDVTSVQLALVEAARESFCDWYFVHRALEINRINQELLLELQEIAETRYAAGVVPKQNALQAEVEYQHLVHRGVVLDRTRDVAAARINTLLNLPPQSPVVPPPKTLPLPVAVPALDALQATALAQRPDLGALARRVRAREADVEAARLEYYPSLRAFGTYNSLWQEPELRPLVGLGVNVPLQLERRRAAVEEARAHVLRARSLLDEKRAAILFEVSQALDEVTENGHVIRLFAHDIIPAAEDNLAAARSGYETETIDFLTLITAEKELMLARLGYESALADYHKARARLDRAVGRAGAGFEEEPWEA